MRTQDQISAGGAVFRRSASAIEIALICVGARRRWQLPKGLVEAQESVEEAAVREAREETGLDAELLAPIDVIEYWYVGDRRGEQVRFHKFVHFFLLAYRAGHVRDHDHEVREARWVGANEARAMLAFENERAMVEKAHAMIEARGSDS